MRYPMNQKDYNKQVFVALNILQYSSVNLMSLLMVLCFRLLPNGLHKIHTRPYYNDFT